MSSDDALDDDRVFAASFLAGRRLGKTEATIQLYPGALEQLLDALAWKPRAGFARRVLLRTGDAGLSGAARRAMRRGRQ